MLGGQAPYWQQWSSDQMGNRLTELDHATANGDATTTYSYPAAGQPQPHTLSSASTTDSTGTRSGSSTYDAAGNTQARPGVSGQQALSWDSEGRLASLSDGSASNSYIYDADGNNREGGRAHCRVPWLRALKLARLDLGKE